MQVTTPWWPAVSCCGRRQSHNQRYLRAHRSCGNIFIEAIPLKGVTTTPLHTVLHREQGHYTRCRVKDADIKKTISNAFNYLGRPYDSLYLADNHAIYCSELVVFSFVDHHDNLVFEQSRMTFHDSTNTIPIYWQELYARHGMKVPEGAPGTNPSELARHSSLRPHKSIK